MANEDLQVHLKARDDLSKELRKTLVTVAKLEAKLREMDNATDGEASRDVEKLSRDLDEAHRSAKTLTRAIDSTDRQIEQMGDSAEETARDMRKMDREQKKTSGGMKGFAATAGKATAAATALAVGIGVAAVGFSKLNTAVGQYQQNVNKTRVVFGAQLAGMTKWAKQHRKDFGGSTQDVLNYAAGVQDLLVPMGFQRQEATKMTKAFSELVPALTAWDKQGRSSAEITDIMAAALTGERESLKSLGVVISQDAVDKQIDLMKSQGKLKDATDEQASAVATLELIYKKTGDAQQAFKDNSDTVARRTQALKSDVLELKDQGLDILLQVWNRVTAAFRKSGFGDGLKSFSKWLSRNSNGIVSWLLSIAAGAVHMGAWFLRTGGMIRQGMQPVLDTVADLLTAMSYLNPAMRGPAQKAQQLAGVNKKLGDAMNDAADKAFTLSGELRDQATIAGRAQGVMDEYRKTLKRIPRNIRVNVEQTITQTGGVAPWDLDSPYFDTKKDKKGDTAAPWGTGPALGADGLAAAHAAYTAGLSGHRITSGVRFDHLGSAQSDHARGRAMDVHGPRMGAYATAVRRAGGYAAFHGSGANRHLHVVPNTARPQAAVAAGDTYTASVTINGDARAFDVRTAVARGLRDAARSAKERGR